MPQRDRIQLLAIIGLVALVAAGLYWPTLRLPLLFDDLLHIRLAEDRTWLTIWQPSPDFGFYRPLVFLPFLISKALFGSYPAPLLHGLNVLQAALNAALLTTLTWRLWRRPPLALAAGLLLATYPFAYQAIAFYGNNIYPLSAGWQLLLLHLYLSARRAPAGKGRRRWALTALFFALGLLSHETLVLFGAFAALLDWNLAGRLPLADLRRHWRRPSHLLQTQPYLAFLLAGVVYAIVYQFLPTGSGPTLDYGGNGLLPKVLYLLQTLVYPLAWAGQRWLDASAPALLFGAGLLVGAGLLLAARRPVARLPLLLGLGWWLLSSVLIGVNLPTYYIEHGARLVYLSGIGATLVWAVLLDSWYRASRWGRPAATLLLAAIVLTSAVFVRQRVAAFINVGEPVSVFKTVMADRPAAEGVLLVNLPAWRAPLRNSYPAGVEYVTLMGDHLFVEELVHHNLALDRPARAVAAPELLTTPAYAYGAHNQATEAVVDGQWAPAGFHIFISTYEAAGIRTTYAGAAMPPAATPTGPPLAQLGPFTLLDATFSCAGGPIAQLTWATTAGGGDGSRSIFAQLLDENGQLVAQADGPPLGLAPWRLALPAGWILVEQRPLTAGSGGQFLIGSYDFTTGARDAALDADGSPLPDNALRLPAPDCGGQ